MCSCLNGGGRAYRLNLEFIKSPRTFSTSNSSSPSSTLSESSNSPLSFFTRKGRTPRKRPNQTFNEAAAILSTAYPKIFPTKHLTKPFKLPKSLCNSSLPFLSEPSDLLMPILERSNFRVESKALSPGEVDSWGNYSGVYDEYLEDFDAGSMLDEEVEEGIDSIMGNLSMENKAIKDSNSMQIENCCYGYQVGLGFGFGYGMRRDLRAIRNIDEGDWWSFPSVKLADITQKIAKIPLQKKKKKKKLESGKISSFSTNKPNEENLATTASNEESIPQPNAARLLLKLNYDDILNAWADKGSPFSADAPAAESTGNNVQERLARIDLFPMNGLARGAIVRCYKEKRRARLLPKKIKYQFNNVNGDQRPRIKGKCQNAKFPR